MMKHGQTRVELRHLEITSGFGTLDSQKPRVDPQLIVLTPFSSPAPQRVTNFHHEKCNHVRHEVKNLIPNSTST